MSESSFCDSLHSSSSSSSSWKQKILSNSYNFNTVTYTTIKMNRYCCSGNIATVSTLKTKLKIRNLIYFQANSWCLDFLWCILRNFNLKIFLKFSNQTKCCWWSLTWKLLPVFCFLLPVWDFTISPFSFIIYSSGCFELNKIFKELNSVRNKKLKLDLFH